MLCSVTPSYLVELHDDHSFPNAPSPEQLHCSVGEASLVPDMISPMNFLEAAWVADCHPHSPLARTGRPPVWAVFALFCG